MVIACKLSYKWRIMHATAYYVASTGHMIVILSRSFRNSTGLYARGYRARGQIAYMGSPEAKVSTAQPGPCPSDILLGRSIPKIGL